MSVAVTTVTVGPLETNAYVVATRGEAIVIDPGSEPRKILHAVLSTRAKVVGIVLTHGHFDHVAAAREVKEATNAPLILPRGDSAVYRFAPQQARVFGYPRLTLPEPDSLVNDGDTIPFGGSSLRVLATPGHTPGGVCLLGDGCLFSGDTLFAGSVGRTDFPGSSAPALQQALRQVILPLPDSLVVYPGHGPSTTVGRERRSNPFLLNLR